MTTEQNTYLPPLCFYELHISYASVRDPHMTVPLHSSLNWEKYIGECNLTPAVEFVFFNTEKFFEK